MKNLLYELCRIKNASTKRISSYDIEGRNKDAWRIEPKETKIVAEIDGPGCITHIWMTQGGPLFLYREVILKFYWDGEENPSILVPVGDFFCLGHSLVNSFCSLPFTASTANPYKFGAGCALNCYLPMPFNKHAKIEITNEGKEPYNQYFYIDYETYEKNLEEDIAYLHACWRRENPTPGWGPEIPVNTPEANIVNKEEVAYKNNYVILEAEGKGHYIGCNISVTNFHGTWWGEGDDMIWVDGYKWPPDLHGTGSEDYFNQAWGMQNNAFLFNGSSIFENFSIFGHTLYDGKLQGGYQTSYVFHLTNPVHFKKSIKVTIEYGHGNHTANDYSSTAYWYQIEPHKKFDILPVEKRYPVMLSFMNPITLQTEKREIVITEEMKKMKNRKK
ncbi:MAG: glycoside hydrolase family 172 protein [Candidatus Ratteibacteria bacterium]